MAWLNTEERAAYNKAYHKKNRADLLLKMRAYRESHRDDINEQKRADYRANRDYFIEVRRKYVAANPVAVAEADFTYRQAHRKEAAARTQSYRVARGDSYKDLEREKVDSARLVATEAGFPWSAPEDAFLMREDGNTAVVKAFILGRTVYGVRHRLDHLRKMAAIA